MTTVGPGQLGKFSSPELPVTVTVTHMRILFNAPIVFEVSRTERGLLSVYGIETVPQLVSLMMSYLHFIYIYAAYCAGPAPASARSSWSSEEIRLQ